MLPLEAEPVVTGTKDSGVEGIDEPNGRRISQQ